jgi:hypothetical protein
MVRSRFNFPEESATPRQQILFEQGFDGFVFIVRGMIFNPGSGQQQRTNVVGWRIVSGIPRSERNARTSASVAPSCQAERYGKRGTLRPRTARCNRPKSAACRSFFADAPANHPVPAASFAPVSFTDHRKKRNQQRVLRLAVIQRTQHAAEDGKLIHFLFHYTIKDRQIHQSGHSARLRKSSIRRGVTFRIRASGKPTSLSTFRHSLKSPSVNAVWNQNPAPPYHRHHARRQPLRGSWLHCPRVNKGGVINFQRHTVFCRRLRNGLNINRELRLPGWLIICTLPLAIVAIIAAVLVFILWQNRLMETGNNQIQRGQHRAGAVDFTVGIFDVRLDAAQYPNAVHQTWPDPHIHKMPVVRRIRHIRAMIGYRKKLDAFSFACAM